MYPLGNLGGPMLAVVRGQGSHTRQWRCIPQAGSRASWRQRSDKPMGLHCAS
jgi:hypothetical protein